MSTGRAGRNGRSRRAGPGRRPAGGGRERGRQQLAEPGRGRVEAARELGHEDLLPVSERRIETVDDVRLGRERQGAIDRLARGDGAFQRVQAEPLGREEVNGVDVRPVDEGRDALGRVAGERPGLDLGAAGHLVVDGGDAESVGHPGQGRLVPRLPEPAEPDHADAEPVLSRRRQHRLPGPARSAILRTTPSSPPPEGRRGLYRPRRQGDPEPRPLSWHHPPISATRLRAGAREVGRSRIIAADRDPPGDSPTTGPGAPRGRAG